MHSLVSICEEYIINMILVTADGGQTFSSNDRFELTIYAALFYLNCIRIVIFRVLNCPLKQRCIVKLFNYLYIAI